MGLWPISTWKRTTWASHGRLAWEEGFPEAQKTHFYSSRGHSLHLGLGWCLPRPGVARHHSEEPVRRLRHTVISGSGTSQPLIQSCRGGNIAHTWSYPSTVYRYSCRGQARWQWQTRLGSSWRARGMSIEICLLSRSECSQWVEWVPCGTKLPPGESRPAFGRVRLALCWA